VAAEVERGEGVSVDGEMRRLDRVIPLYRLRRKNGRYPIHGRGATGGAGDYSQ